MYVYLYIVYVNTFRWAFFASPVAKLCAFQTDKNRQFGLDLPIYRGFKPSVNHEGMASCW